MHVFSSSMFMLLIRILHPYLYIFLTSLSQYFEQYQKWLRTDGAHNVRSSFALILDA
jgi:hypothetical protein